MRLFTSVLSLVLLLQGLVLATPVINPADADELVAKGIIPLDLGSEKKTRGDILDLKLAKEPRGNFPFDLVPSKEPRGNLPFDLVPSKEPRGNLPLDLVPSKEPRGHLPLDLVPSKEPRGHLPFDLVLPVDAANKI
ncbi:hypothetical protein AX17_001443 [Amanita inopinata Kibby_2008]|nr:hypothetical protein AX17_001443 [Amanita inopinata Kibby_2008]